MFAKRTHRAQECRAPVGGKVVQEDTGVPGWATVGQDDALLTMS